MLHCLSFLSNTTQAQHPPTDTFLLIQFPFCSDLMLLAQRAIVEFNAVSHIDLNVRILYKFISMSMGRACAAWMCGPTENRWRSVDSNSLALALARLVCYIYIIHRDLRKCTNNETPEWNQWMFPGWCCAAAAAILLHWTWTAKQSHTTTSPFCVFNDFEINYKIRWQIWHIVDIASNCSGKSHTLERARQLLLRCLCCFCVAINEVANAFSL